MLAERGRDMADGLSLRSLVRRVEEHGMHDERRFDRLEGRLRELEQGLARTQGHEDRNLTPGAFAPLAVPINMGPAVSVRSKRPSLPPWAKAAIKPAAHWLGMVLIAFVVAAASRCEHTSGLAPTAPPPHAAER